MSIEGSAALDYAGSEPYPLKPSTEQHAPTARLLLFCIGYDVICYDTYMVSTHAKPSLQPKRLLVIAAVTSFILLIPLAAMQFTTEVMCSPADFMLAGALLLGTGLLYEVISANLNNRAHRIIAGGALAIILLLVWVQLAVGIFD